MIRTDDLFLAAFALARGGELIGLDVQRTNGRRVAVFAIDGPGVEDAERDYFRGTTSVDVQHLRVHVRRLKDRIFDALRADERRARMRRRDSEASSPATRRLT